MRPFVFFVIALLMSTASGETLETNYHLGPFGKENIVATIHAPTGVEILAQLETGNENVLASIVYLEQPNPNDPIVYCPPPDVQPACINPANEIMVLIQNKAYDKAAGTLTIRYRFTVPFVILEGTDIVP